MMMMMSTLFSALETHGENFDLNYSLQNSESVLVSNLEKISKNWKKINK